METSTMENMFIVSFFIAVLSPGSLADCRSESPDFIMCYENSELVSVFPKEYISVPALTLDLAGPKTINAHALIGLKFDHLTVKNSGGPEYRRTEEIVKIREPLDHVDAKELKIERLNMAFNRFTKLKSVKKLTYWKVFGDVSFADYPQLEEFFGYYWEPAVGTLDSSDFSRTNRGLKTIILWQSFITFIGGNAFERFQNLTSLEVRWNSLSDLKKGLFTGLHQLQYLDLSNSGIERIEADAFNGLSLLSLDLSQNKITKLGPETFRGLRVERLRLAENSISDIDPNSFLNVGLREISLDYNRLGEVPSALSCKDVPSLSDVDLSHNKIKELKAGIFQNCSLPLELRLANNEIQNFPSDFFSGSIVYLLDLANNKLENPEITSLISVITFKRDGYLGLARNSMLNLDESSLKKINSAGITFGWPGLTKHGFLRGKKGSYYLELPK